jgi:hypothetical protein
LCFHNCCNVVYGTFAMLSQLQHLQYRAFHPLNHLVACKTICKQIDPKNVDYIVKIGFPFLTVCRRIAPFQQSEDCWCVWFSWTTSSYNEVTLLHCRWTCQR